MVHGLTCSQIVEGWTKHSKGCCSAIAPYFLEVEKAAMAKSYKMVLLEALLELDGFIHPQTTQNLAIRSAEILLHRPAIDEEGFASTFSESSRGSRFQIWPMADLLELQSSECLCGRQ